MARIFDVWRLALPNTGQKKMYGADLSGLSGKDRVERIRDDISGGHFCAASFEGSDLSGVNMSGADFSGANLKGATIGGSATMVGASLSSADLRGASMVGLELRDAKMGGADLRGANLEGADLRNADLAGADLRGAFLTGANLDGANTDGAVFGPEQTALVPQEATLPVTVAELCPEAEPEVGPRYDIVSRTGSQPTTLNELVAGQAKTEWISVSWSDAYPVASPATEPTIEEAIAAAQNQHPIVYHEPVLIPVGPINTTSPDYPVQPHSAHHSGTAGLGSGRNDTVLDLVTSLQRALGSIVADERRALGHYTRFY